MDDATPNGPAPLGGWVPTERARTQPTSESLFEPRVPTQPRAAHGFGSAVTGLLDSAPAQPLGTAPARPLNTAPAWPLDTPPAKPLGTTPAWPLDTPPARPLGAAPAGMLGATPATRLRSMSRGSPRSAAAGAGLMRLSLTRLSRALRYARPSTWRPPARLGSGPVRTLRLFLARHRRLLGVCLTLLGLGITIRAAAPPAPPTVAVLVAARDLPAGRTLTSADLQSASWPVSQAPGGRLIAATGRKLASPIRTGEPVTDARVVGPGLLAGQAPGTVAVPVRLGDPAAGALVQAGDRVDVLASASSSWSASSGQFSEPDLADGTAPEGNGQTGSRSTSSATTDGGAERVAAGALVLAAPGASSADDGSGSTGAGLSDLAGGTVPDATSAETSTAGLLVLAVSSREAARLTALQTGRYLGIAVLPQR
jgi:Flp pilus assembly protein CpaB